MITGPNPCFHCNREVKNPRYFVEFHATKGLRKAGDPAFDDADPANQGAYPVGADCMKQLRAAGIYIYDHKKGHDVYEPS